MLREQKCEKSVIRSPWGPLYLLHDTYRSLAIGDDLYAVKDAETPLGIIRFLFKNGKVVGAFRRDQARELGLLLGGNRLLTVNEYTHDLRRINTGETK